MKRFFLLSILLLSTSLIFAQEELSDSNVSLKENITRYSIDRDTSVFFLIRDFWKANQNYSYITFPVVKSIGERKIDLEPGEGEKGYKFEALIDVRYSILQPRINSMNFVKLSRFTLDYRSNFRMTADESSPLTPATQDVGLGFDVNLWNNQLVVKKQMFKYSTMNSMPQGEVKSLSMNIQAHHYSNGQPAGFFKYTVDSSDFRNDYDRGDFSTNYVKIGLLYNQLSKENNLWSASMWARFDGDFFGLEFTPVQQFRIGQNRVGLMIDYHSKPLARKKAQQWKQGGEVYLLKRMYTLDVRLSSETILGKLHLFDANLEGNSGKFRTNFALHVHYQPLSSNAIGFLFNGYFGRDYLNIRYDDIIWTAQVGISITLDRYYPMRWNSIEGVIFH